MLAKMKKRGLALFVAMVMVLGMLPTAALAEGLELGGSTTETIVVTPGELTPEESGEPAPEESGEPTPEESGEPTPEESGEPAPEESGEPAPMDPAPMAPMAAPPAPVVEVVEVQEYHLMTREDFQNYCWEQAGQEIKDGHWVTALVLNGFQIIDVEGNETARQADIAAGDGYNVYGNVEWSGLQDYIQPDEVAEIVLYGTYVDNYTWGRLELPWFQVAEFEYHISADEFDFYDYDANTNTQAFCEVYFKDKTPEPPVEEYYTGTVTFTYGYAGEEPVALPGDAISDLPLEDGVWTITLPEAQLEGWTEDGGRYTKDLSDVIPVTVEIDGVTYTLDAEDRTVAVSADGETNAFHYAATKPSGKTQTVYVYVDATQAAGTDGIVNDHGYFTVGTIEMDLPEASLDYSEGGEEFYQKNAEAVAAALENMQWRYNEWLKDTEIEWYTLHASDGADDFVDSGTMTWHLDGRITAIPDLYTVTYNANNNTGATHVDTSKYRTGDTVTVLSNDVTGFTCGEETFLGWSTASGGEVEYKPGDAFLMGETDVYLYAVWGEPAPATVSFTLKKVDSEDANVTLAGAEFTVYADAACTELYQVFTTGEDGAVEVVLPVGGTYYMKETKAPEGYRILDEKVYELKTEDNSSEGFLSQLWALLTGGEPAESDNFLDGVLTVENVKTLPVKYFVLSPEQPVPADGADMGYQNYFPNSVDPDAAYTADNGMPGTGLTAQLWETLKGGNGTLEIGDQLLDFVSADAGTLDENAQAAMADAFDLNETIGDYEIVWYVVKVQRAPAGSNFGMLGNNMADVHVDGYVKGVAVEVRYHDNYSAEDTFYTHADILTGSDYTVLDYNATDLTAREDYTFQGWATTADGEVVYAAGAEISPLKSAMDLYAVWQKSELPPVVGTPALDITKTADHDTVTVGDEIAYTITVTNTGDAEAENVVVTDTLPEGVTYLESTGNGSYDADARTIAWTVGALAAEESETVTVTVSADEAGTVTNTAEAIADEVDAVEDDATVTVNGGGTPVDPPVDPPVNPPVDPDGGDDDDDDNPPVNPGDDDDDDDDDDVVIEDEDTPLGPNPGQTEETPVVPEIDIPGEEVPLTDTPEIPADPDETVEITDEGVPMGDLPKTGTMAAPAAPTVTMGVLAISASMAAAGLAITVSRKREEDSQN